VAAVCLPLGAQVQFSGQITTNSSTPVTLANPANYTEQVTTVGVSSTGAMMCTSYPQITFLMTRGGVQQVLGFVATSAGSSWTAAPYMPIIQAGDVVTAEMSANEVGCTNGLPLTVYFVAQYQANVTANLTNLAAHRELTPSCASSCRTAAPTIPR
jgi:hypothetical protein